MRSHWKAHCCGVLFGLALGGSATAQPRGDSIDALKKAFEADSKRRSQLFAGEIQPTEDDARIAQAAANWYTWRATHPHVPGNIHDEFSRQVAFMLEKNISTGKKRDNKKFIDMFGRALIVSMTGVLQRDADNDRSTVIQAAMMLPTMAKLKQDDVGDYLLNLIANKKSHDIVRLYAIKALKEYMPVTPLDENANFGNLKVLAGMLNDAKYVDALSQFITRPINVMDLTREEIEVIRYLRREAIASLAEAGAPAVLALKKPAKLGAAAKKLVGKQAIQVEGLVAPTLLRVLAEDLLLQPTLKEKLEAAHGICNMKFDKMREYQPDPAVFLVGSTLQQFVSEYNKDWANIKEKRTPPAIAWKAEARRFKETSLLQLKTTSGEGAAEMCNAAMPILTSIGAHKQTAETIEFNALVAILRPTSPNVFKTIKTPPIPLPK